VPANLTNAIAISAGGQQSLALRKNGTVAQWGQTFATAPSGTNFAAIASGTNFHIALLSNSTVVTWGANNSGTNVPANLSNVVAIAAGGAHGLALKDNGTVVAWGANSSGQTNVPSGLTNVMAIAAGYGHSLALSNNGTVVAWGDNTHGQTNAPPLTQVKLLAAGGYQSLASVFSPILQYRIDVSRDLLLVYNTNSIDSSNVCAYYLQHRPMVGGANVLGIPCVTNETALWDEYTNQIASPIFNWLYANPTKRPGYIILFLDVPSRVHKLRDYSDGGDHESVSVSLHDSYPGLSPFITHINFNGTNDCRGYIDKLASFGSNYSSGKLLISASPGGYGNTNWLFDDANILGYVPLPGQMGSNGVVANGAATSSVTYLPSQDLGLSSHITSGTNVAGYLCWGVHSSLGGGYATNLTVKFYVNSAWYLIATVESFNGDRGDHYGQGNFIKWFSPNSFGGTNYQTTPIGGVSYVDEPGFHYINDSQIYFGAWQSGKNLGICGWSSIVRNFGGTFVQIVGDPLLTK
jgi:hypothetical protein